MKQEELLELRERVFKLQEEVAAYKRMCDEYKEAADERWERLQFYEKSNLGRIICGLNIRLKKKELNDDSEEFYEEENDDFNSHIPIKERYYRIYSQEELDGFNECKKRLSAVCYQPLISLVIPVYNTDLRLLKELVFSLKEQIYENWEVCFANGSFDNDDLNRVLAKFSKNDPRIRHVILDKNGGISYNTNKAFEMARGEYIGMVDHDDLLTPDALAEVVLELNKKPELDFIYSDQDKVDEKTSVRFGRLYKPSWSLELLYSGNYITHFSVVRKSVIEKIGGWDFTTDGAQDWDLFLKVAEITNNVCGIPKVLYHWRTAPTSTAASMENKNYAAEAQIRTLQNHFERKGYPIEVTFSRPEDLEIHVQWKNISTNVSVIIWDTGVNRELDSYLLFIQLVLKDRLNNIIFVSNNKERLNNISTECKKIHVETDLYAAGYNTGIKHAEGEVLLFLTDCVFPVEIDSYSELIAWTKHPEIGVVSPKFLNMLGSVKSMGILLNRNNPRSIFDGVRNEPGRLTSFGTTSWYRNVNAADYSCFAIEKAKLHEVGLFSENLKWLAMVDFCLKIRRKYRNLVNPFSVMKTREDYVDTINKFYLEEYGKLLEEYNMPETDMYGNVELSEF